MTNGSVKPIEICMNEVLRVAHEVKSLAHELVREGQWPRGYKTWELAESLFQAVMRYDMHDVEEYCEKNCKDGCNPPS